MSGGDETYEFPADGRFEIQWCCGQFCRAVETKRVEFEISVGWVVTGCCGGGCFRLVDLYCCPWCSKSLKPPKEMVTVWVPTKKKAEEKQP